MTARLRSAFVASALLLFVACGAKVDDPSSSGDCPAPSPGTCAPGAGCVDGMRRTGEAKCVDHAWSCVEEACGDAATDAGSSDGGCDGTVIPTCVGGRVSAGCCPLDAPCVAPLPFCDLGGGACVAGDCPVDGGCAKGSISASSYDQACATDADCVGVFDGDLCGLCFCPNASINVAARAAWQADFDAHHPGPSTCSCPFLGLPKCAAGRCTFAR